MAAQSRRGSWSQQDLENAMTAIDRGAGISIREAAKQFGIPRRTLRNHIKSGSMEKRLGRKSLMCAEEEQMLVNRIVRFSDIGLPLTAKMIRSYVFEYFEKNNLKHSFTSNLAGEKWFRLFLNRHPELRHRKAQEMNPARAQKLNSSPHISFDYIMKTPTKTKKKTVTRAKSINCRATVISKSLFERSANTNGKTGKGKGKGVGKGKSAKKSKAKPTINDTEEDWFCPGCGENEQEDMRRCESCGVWYHEDCVGLTKDDETFVCPECDAKKIDWKQLIIKV